MTNNKVAFTTTVFKHEGFDEMKKFSDDACVSISEDKVSFFEASSSGELLGISIGDTVTAHLPKDIILTILKRFTT